MSYQLNEYKKQLAVAKNSYEAEYNTIYNTAKAYFEKIMSTPAARDIIDSWITTLDETRNLTDLGDIDGWYASWIRVDFNQLINTEDTFECELLQDFLEDHYNVVADYDNNCLLYSLGPSILIIDGGDVYDQDSGRIIIHSEDYANPASLIAAIDSWQDKHGYYPAVLSVNRYGDVQFFQI